MKIIVHKADDGWHPEPVPPPTVDPEFTKMNGLQRATESLRYVLLRWEHWVSPNGDIREWLRCNTRIGAWLLIPAVCVMPAVGFVLWQITGWVAMLTSIAGRLIVLPILILVAFIVIKIVVALLKR